MRPASQASRSLRGESFSALNEDSLPNTNSIAPEEDSLRDPAGNAEGAEEEDEEELDGEAYAWFEEIASRVQVEDFSFIDYEVSKLSRLRSGCMHACTHSREEPPFAS